MTIILNGTTGVTFPNGVTMSDGTSAPVTVAQGGTGANTASAARTALGVAIGTDVLAPNGSGANLTSLNASSVSSGTLGVANGGTGATTLTANNVLLGNGTSALQAVAPGSSGNILTSNGTTWVSSTPAGGGVTSLNGQTGAITNTSINTIGSYVIATGVISSMGSLFTVNSTYSGTILRLGNMNMYSYYNGLATDSSPLSGTWRMLGGGGARGDTIGDCGGVLFVRVS